MGVAENKISPHPQHAIPRMDDARHVAAIISADARVEKISVFGSVAKGDASEQSDIDLLVLITHLSDCEYDDAVKTLRMATSTQCPWPVDLIVQRRGDYEFLSNNVTASFEHFVVGHSRLLYQAHQNMKPAPTTLNVVVGNNMVLAAQQIESLNVCLEVLIGAVRNIPVQEAELKSYYSKNSDTISHARKRRYRALLEQSHMVVEQSYRAVSSSVDGKSLGKGHEILDYEAVMQPSVEQALLSQAVNPIRDTTLELRTWRFVSYAAELKDWDAEITPGNTSKHILAAISCAEIAANALEQRTAKTEPYVSVIQEARTSIKLLRDAPISPHELENGATATSKPKLRWFQRWIGKRKQS